MDRALRGRRVGCRRRRPSSKEQLAAAETDIRKTEEAVERYSLAFGAGTMNEQACFGRIERLAAHLADFRCDRVWLQNAIDFDDRVPTWDEIEEILAEIREMINSGTREDHRTLTSVLVGLTRVDGRH